MKETFYSSDHLKKSTTRLAIKNTKKVPRSSNYENKNSDSSNFAVAVSTEIQVS